MAALFVFSAEVVEGNERNFAAVKSRTNVVSSKTNWYVQVDAFGTTVDTGSVLNNGRMVSALFTVQPLEKDEEWPYAEIMVGLGGSMEGFRTIEITYESNTEVVLKLVQTDMGKDGDGSYAYYEFLLPKSNWMHTEKVKVSNFHRPDWTPEEGNVVKYNAANVWALQVVPDIDEMVGGSATVKIKNLILR